MECWVDEACAAGSPFHHSTTPLLHYSISHGANTHLALLQNATAHVLANSAIASLIASF
jgi:hypothetical protein